jgi:hypothetical protein
MGWRTAGTTVRAGVAGAVALGVLAALPGAAAHAAGSGGYAFDPAARSLTAATATSGAGRLHAGGTYRSALPPAGKAYYRIDLDAASTAYVAVTAVPPSGADVSATDGIRVSLQNADSHYCSTDTAAFGAARSPRPITAWGAREGGSARPACRDAGPYYVVVERLRASDPKAAKDTWDLELTAATEAPPKEPGPTSAPGEWNSASPEPPPGEPAQRRAGAGFATAAPVGQGAWSGTVTPGQTLFYKVPVDWGQQLNATAELGGAPGGDRAGGGGIVAGALNLSVYNPVRAHVADATAYYGGDRKAATLAALPPVAYRNRHAVRDAVSGMRFAGSYYLVVHLADGVAERFGDGPFGLTLRVRIDGTPAAGPGYAGRSTPQDLFRVTEQDRRDAAGGGFGGLPGGGTGATAADGAGGGTAMKALAVGGIGTGTVLLAVLGGWTAAARRRAAQIRASAQNPTA